VNVRGEHLCSSPADVAAMRLSHPILSEGGTVLPRLDVAWTGSSGGYDAYPAQGITLPTPLPAGYPVGSVSYARCSTPLAETPWATATAPGMVIYGAVATPSLLGSATLGAAPPLPTHPPPPTPGYYASMAPCDMRAHLYCFESSAISYPAPSPAAVPASAIVLFSHTRFGTPGTVGGRAAMDVACQTDADGHGLTGRYVALVGSAASGESALSRVLLSGPVFRPDGVVIADDLTALGATTDDALTRTNVGSLIAATGGAWTSNPGYVALTGFSAGGAGAVPSGADDCSGYTSTSGSTAYGIGDGLRFSRWGREGVIPCAASRPISWYCVRAE
jgi:hypothetical protein